ncbi:hypothetical protein CSUI_008106 [Cystoisospora suis]|uniref:Uncharacterized protein n=1 Tax=Cystoisospora suis TaxID=483139 RepID=A0A2C6KKI5_9APIC|nr:hypothetical protein CSUI_008106 [Cystoisospora suis]
MHYLALQCGSYAGLGDNLSPSVSIDSQTRAEEETRTGRGVKERAVNHLQVLRSFSLP